MATHILGFGEDGHTFFTPGDYDYYLEKRPRPDAVPAPLVKPPPPAPVRPAKVRLTYREQQELAHIEEDILAAEARASEIEALFGRPDFYAEYGPRTAELRRELDETRETIRTMYDRWDFLERKKSSQEA